MRQVLRYFIITFLMVIPALINRGIAQSAKPSELWHGKTRVLHYEPMGDGFRLVKGKRKFNRALYGTNTGFRVETGDLPEFAMYLPGMGGNIRFAMSNGTATKWITLADSIATIYTHGKMHYSIRDPMLGKGILELDVVAMADAEGAIIKLEARNIPEGVMLYCVYGGVSGKKFSRDGDIGADPEDVFYLKPEYCTGNEISIAKNNFSLTYNSGRIKIEGVMPAATQLSVGDAGNYQNQFPSGVSNGASVNPVLVGKMELQNTGPQYFAWRADTAAGQIDNLPAAFDLALQSIEKLTKRVKLQTPDPWLNTLGGALAIAGDAIWDPPTYMHGAIAWRMRLPAWRGANVADPLGWHDRAHLHFSSYAKSQVTTPLSAPVVMDTALHLARHLEKIGTGMFTSGYICRNPNGDIRPHHYDMNLVFIDQMLSHFEWTGDTAFLREMWPVITRHLEWEKRNFDSDGDGLYDAYCCIWASDALQYSGGGVTHSTSYNYRAFSKAATLAGILGYDGSAYHQEATKILKALQSKLWLKDKGWFAEYKDLLGNKLVHPSAGLWTIYHAIDSRVPDAFQAYQMMRYVDKEIPHIPIHAGRPGGSHYLLSTTNWMPYTWSVNNVAMGEIFHTALAYWQAGRSQQAFQLWKSAMVESMYFGASPGSFIQISFYDAIRGELYRDFADGVGMAARSLVEGLFGISPDALADTLTIAPGFPNEWLFASLDIPDVKVDFKILEGKDHYSITQAFERPMHLHLRLQARGTLLPVVEVNGKVLKGTFDKDAVGNPVLDLLIPKAQVHLVTITWKGDRAVTPTVETFTTGSPVSISFGNAKTIALNDPQGVLKASKISGNILTGTIASAEGHKTLFVQLQIGDATWWAPVHLEVVPTVTLLSFKEENNNATFIFSVQPGKSEDYQLLLNSGSYKLDISTPAKNITWTVPASELLTGTNQLTVKQNGKTYGQVSFGWWKKQTPTATYEALPIGRYFNARVTDIFEQSYLSPRPVGPTLQIPTQGIGNWCYPLVTGNINDSGFRAKAGPENMYRTSYGFGFSTPAQMGTPNIAFVSQWDNYPKQLELPLSGTAQRAYLLMAGTTNHMQSRFENARVVIHYQDGSKDSLPLVNPENWWPIEQDYYEDGFAFARESVRPPRVYLLDGSMSTEPLPKYSSIKGLTGMAIEGGAATIVDMPLQPGKKLKKLTLEAIANEVVVGLMGVTLVR